MDPAGYERGLKALLERRFDVHVIHVLAPDEMNPSVGGDLRLVDAETGELRDLTARRRGAAGLPPAAARVPRGRRAVLPRQGDQLLPGGDGHARAGLRARPAQGPPARMSFLSPLALLLSALSVPLLLLYFLKVRRRQMRVSSLLLWDPALRDREASTFFQRLAARPAAAAPDPGATGPDRRARPARGDGDGARGQAGRHRARQLGVHEGHRRVAVALRPGPARGARGPGTSGRRAPR